MLKDHESITICDTTTREGQQARRPSSRLNESRGFTMSYRDIRKWLQYHIDFGTDFVEFGAPVRDSSSEKRLREVVKIADDSENLRIALHGRSHVIDVDSMLSVNQYSEKGVLVCMFVGTSDENIAGNGTSFNQRLDAASSAIDYAHSQHPNIEISFSTEDGFRTPEDRLIKFITAIAGEAGNRNIIQAGIADTTGVADPFQVRDRFSHLTTLFPDIRFKFHGHDDRGFAGANYFAAALGGARYFDVSLLGERNGIITLPGLIAALTDKDEYQLERLISTKYDWTRLRHMYVFARDQLKVPIDGLPIVSDEAFTHGAGVHVKALRSSTQSYQELDPSVYGRAPFVLSATSVAGAANILNRAEELGLQLSTETAQQLADKVRRRGRSSQGVTQNYVDLLIVGSTV